MGCCWLILSIRIERIQRGPLERRKVCKAMPRMQLDCFATDISLYTIKPWQKPLAEVEIKVQINIIIHFFDYNQLTVAYLSSLFSPNRSTFKFYIFERWRCLLFCLSSIPFLCSFNHLMLILYFYLDCNFSSSCVC